MIRTCGNGETQPIVKIINCKIAQSPNIYQQ